MSTSTPFDTLLFGSKTLYVNEMTPEGQNLMQAFIAYLLSY